jgi:hypothetical protein
VPSLVLYSRDIDHVAGRAFHELEISHDETKVVLHERGPARGSNDGHRADR